MHLIAIRKLQIAVTFQASNTQIGVFQTKCL